RQHHPNDLTQPLGARRQPRDHEEDDNALEKDLELLERARAVHVEPGREGDDQEIDRQQAVLGYAEAFPVAHVVAESEQHRRRNKDVRRRQAEERRRPVLRAYVQRDQIKMYEKHGAGPAAPYPPLSAARPASPATRLRHARCNDRTAERTSASTAYTSASSTNPRMHLSGME